MSKFIKMTAKFQSKCRICGETIQAGDEILLGPKVPKRKRYTAHIECADRKQQSKRVEGIPEHLHSLVEGYQYGNPAKEPTRTQMNCLVGSKGNTCPAWRDIDLTHKEASDIIDRFNLWVGKKARKKGTDRGLKRQVTRSFR